MSLDGLGVLWFVDMHQQADDPVVAAATAGDEVAFATLVRRHERELHVHCYRMLGSFTDAEDAVQETFLRAWRHRDTFDGGPGFSKLARETTHHFRAWLYRIATNVCLDALRRNDRQLTSLGSFAEVPWLQPYPDRLLAEMAPPDDEPDAVVVARETIELAFLAAIQLLPPNQRAVLILRDVLGWSANETADALSLSLASANSALQRARATLREQLPRRRLDWSASEPTPEERDLLLRFIDAHERGDVEASLAMVRDDIRITMPPNPWCYDGVETLKSLLGPGLDRETIGDWRLVPTSANLMPTAASYLRAPGDTEYRAFKLDVLRVEDGLIVEITTFDASLFPAFGLPATLS